MRLKPGRPSLEPYRDRFDVPEAGGGLGVTFLGVSSLLVDDGSSALLTDGFFSRPSMASVLLRRLSPSRERIDACLRRLDPGLHVEAVLPVHSHYDHAMDSAVVAERLGAALVGGSSTAQIGLGHGLFGDQVLTASPGTAYSFGPWTVTLIESHHCPPDRYPGTITEPVRPPVKVGAYRCGEAWSILLAHTSGRTALIQGSAGFVPGALAERAAEVAYLGVGQLGLMDAAYIETYWTETVRTVGARHVVLTHWDDFFRPLPLTEADPPLRALPYAGDDLDVTMRILTRLADADGVRLSFPTVWRREDPWA